MNFIEALQTYAPRGKNFNSLPSTFKDFDDVFGGFPQYGLISILGNHNSKLESFTWSILSNYVGNYQMSNILYLNFRGDIHERTIIKHLRSIILDMPYDKLCNVDKWKQEDYEIYDNIVNREVLRNETCFKTLFIESIFETDLNSIKKNLYGYVRDNGIKVIIIDDFTHILKATEGHDINDILSMLKDLCSYYHVTIILNVYDDCKQNAIMYNSNLVINLASSNTRVDECNELMEVKVLKNDFGSDEGSIKLYYNKITRGIYSQPHLI
jgi:hypothetical protein